MTVAEFKELDNFAAFKSIINAYMRCRMGTVDTSDVCTALVTYQLFQASPFEANEDRSLLLREKNITDSKLFREYSQVEAMLCM